MIKLKLSWAIVLAGFYLASCNSDSKKETTAENSTAATSDYSGKLPPPDTTHQAKKFSKVIGWPAGKTPVAPAGFKVTKFAEKLRNPRWIYVGPNGDIFVAEASTKMDAKETVAAKLTGKSKSQNLNNSANRITLFRDTNKDGTPDMQQVFLSGLKQPFGMLILNNYFYVASTDGLWRFPYETGQTTITNPAEKVIKLPAGGYNNHWTRNIIANADGSKIYISVGSGSNVGENGMEHEVRRANILEINPDGSGEKIYAAGLRNPVGMDWAPGTNTLWTAVNERDELGDDLVPDYLTSVQQDKFYGWPYAYWGANEDPRMQGKRPDLVQATIAPDVNLGSHTASLGLAFYDQKTFPGKYQNGAFIGQHGSWNRSELVGYKVVYVPFKNGKPAGKPEDFLTGFIADLKDGEVYGRPVGITVLPDGSMLVADDAANTIWRVSAS